jgi:hypothetical protein
VVEVVKEVGMIVMREEFLHGKCMYVNLVKMVLEILMDPEVCEGLQRAYYCDRVEGCIEVVEFAWVAVIDTHVMKVGQGSLDLKKVCPVGGKGCALDLLLVYMLILPSWIRVMTAMTLGTPGEVDMLG